MDVLIRDIPYGVNTHALKRKIASIVHSPDFSYASRDADQRLINFTVWLKPSEIGRAFSDGVGKVIFPSFEIGAAFLDYVKSPEAKIRKMGGNKLRFKKSSGRPNYELTETLSKTPYIDPDIEEKHEQKVAELDERIRINELHFGLMYHSHDGPVPCPRFSSEWMRDLTRDSVGWLKFNYDQKSIAIKVGDPNRESTGHGISILFSNINKISVGYELGSPYLCFDLITPPVFEEVEFHAPVDGGRNAGMRRRVPAIHDGHARIAPYAYHLRLVLYNKVYTEGDLDIIKDFIHACTVSEIDAKVEQLQYPAVIESHGPMFLTPKRLDRLQRWLTDLPFPVAFQVEALHRRGLVNTTDLLEGQLYSEISNLAATDSERLAELLRRFYEALELRNGKESPWKCYVRVKREFSFSFLQLHAGAFRCCHVTVAPTRLLLEGPYATQSNRVLRKYKEYEGNFLRVDFRDEDRLQYRWDRNVDGSELLRVRVGRTLKEGLNLAGRHFRFLAYSSSSLREHTVWFILPFQLPDGKWVTPESIRGGLGEFHELIRQPSKLAARVAQAFTATDPSVTIKRDEWEIVPDLKDQCKKPNEFTDGCGIISKSLGDRIWAALCADRRTTFDSIPPSAYQIRFLGCKGVVYVCSELEKKDKNTRGIHMRLHESMKKFENTSEEESPIEIARAFDYPNRSHLNRPLVMILEDRGVRRETFLRLQNEAIKDIMTIDESLDQFRTSLVTHSLGSQYRIGSILLQLKQVLGLDLHASKTEPSCDSLFLSRIRRVATVHVLRDIKYRARIPIPNSWMLVGVADEGPAFIRDEGYDPDDIYLLPENHIYACVQEASDDEPTYLSGICLISRNPVVHPGDVQRVYAIGKPPEDKICAFRDVINVVVLPSQASCLGGGDVDGDQFDIIQYGPLLAVEHFQPASYDASDPRKLDRECTTEDICDFIVEYIQSDVLGLLSVRHLIIADQSKDGSKDPLCIKLAKLCSQAVDYPKNGVPVDITNLPKQLMRYNPDWQAAEITKPRDTDYYRSDRALGYLYRAVNLDYHLPEDAPNQHATALQDAISSKLIELLQSYIEVYTDFESVPIDLDQMFKRYADELRYISTTHTVTNGPADRLLEEEIVIGTILSKCTQQRFRADRTYRMRLHASALVNNLQRMIFTKVDEMTREEVCSGLQNAWAAWVYSQHRMRTFGANSFGLIALGMIFEIFELLMMSGRVQ